jgi:hypothetical protein
MTINESVRALIDQGFPPEQYMRAYWSANPPEQSGHESEMTVRFYEYGTRTAIFEKEEWERAFDAGRLDHLIDHVVSDMETDTLLVGPGGTILDPYGPDAEEAAIQ